MSKTYVGIKLQDLGLYNTLDPKDKIVIVKDKDEGVLQLKDFFLYVQSNLDLSNYYTSTQADTIFMAKVDAYTRKDADLKFALVEKTYTRTQSDTRFALAADTFTKAEIEGKYASKEQMYTKNLVYTKDEAITAFALKTEIPILPDLTPYSTTAKGDLRWALKVDVFSKTEADARFANINNYYTKTQSDTKYALLTNTYTKAETDNKFLDTTEAYNKDYINLNIYTKTQVYTKAETDGKYPLKTDVYTVTAVNDQFAAKSWVYSRAEADNTFRKLADSYNRAEVNALIDASKSGLSTDVSNTYYTKTDVDNKFELKGTAYNKIDSDAKYALISTSISPSQVASKYYNKTEIDKAFGDSATNTSNLFALKSAAVGGISLTPTNLTFTKVDGTSNIVTIPTWNQSTTGNAATATKLATPRAIAISGAVTATGVNFDGSSNIDINATSLDATKLTGIVPNANLNGLYSNVDIQLSNNRTIFTTNSNTGRTVYGLADFQYSGAFTGCIVFKTTIPKNNNTMFQLHISGMLYGDGILDTIVKTYQYDGDLKTNGARISRGTADVLIRFGATPDGYICVIIGDVDKSWYFPHISITHGVLSHGVASHPGYVKGWTSYNTNDLTGYTMVTTPYTNEVSVTNVAWGNVQNKPTTVSGYGITDAYTKADLYTKIESDNRFSFKQESIQSATLNTSTLSFTKADNTVSNISIPTWNQSTTGNAATATKLATPRTINGVVFDGSGDISTPATGTVTAIDDRVMVPNDLPLRSLGVYFTSKGGLETTTANTTWGDFLTLNTYGDSSGGGVNALFFTKGSQGIYHYFTPFGSTNPFPTPKQIAYTDSNITGNAATATRWQTARTFNITGDATWSASVDGTSNITGALTLANTGVIPGTYTKVTIDSKGRATSASNLVSADIPNLDMSKVNTGVLGINQGGTGATTAATARTNLGLGTSAVLNVGVVNGVASLDASGKVPTGQLYINNTLTSTDTTVPLTAAQGKVLNDNIGTTNTNLQTLTNRLDTNYYLKSDVFTKTEITTNYFDKTYVNNNFLAQAANKDVSIAGFINAGKDILFTTSLTGIKWNLNADNASIVFKNNGNGDTDSYLGFDVGDNGDEYFRWSFSASSSNKIAMSLRRDKLEINNSVATLGLSTSASLTDISKIPQYGIYSKGNVKTDGQIITNATSHHVNISDLGVGNDSPIRIPAYIVPQGGTGYIPFLHGSAVTATSGYTMHSSLGLYRANNTWFDGGMYMAIGGDDRYPTVAFRFKLDGTIDFTGGSVSLAGNANSASKLQTARNISLTGDGSWSTSFDGTGNSTGSFVLSNSGVNAGTYTKVTVDSKGRVASGTGLLPGDIPALDTSKLTSGILPIARGGTGAGDAATARNKLGLGSAAPYNVGINAGQIRTNDMMVDISNAWNSSADGDKFSTYIPTNGSVLTPVALGNVGAVDYGSGMANRYIFDNVEYIMGWSLGLFNGYMYRFYARRDLSTNKWTQYNAVFLDTFNSSSTNIQFNTVKIVSPATTTVAPNTFIDTNGEIKKSSYSFGSAATKNTGTNDGEVMTVGSFGIGTNAISYFDNSSTAAVRSSTSGKSGIYRNSATGATSFIHSPTLYMGTGDTHGMLSIDYNNYGVRVLSWHDSTVNTPFVRNLYHDKSTVIYNTTIDDVANVYITPEGTLKRATRVIYDASSLSGTINNSNLSGTYNGFNLELTGNRTVYTNNSNGKTVYGLADFMLQGGLTGCIVFKTTIPKTSNTMFQLHISGMLYGDGILDTIVKTYQYDGDLKTNGARISRGTADVLIRFGATPDGFICIIIGTVDKGWYFPHISITHGLLSNDAKIGYLKGWTAYAVTDLTGYTAVTVPFENNVSVAKVSWANVANRATTRDGYGITDVYTKADLYTKAEADAKFSYKLESIKSATLNTSTLSFTKADNTVTNIPIPTWNQDTSGNADTATKLQNSRYFNIIGAAAADPVYFDGTGNVSLNVTAMDATKLLGKVPTGSLSGGYTFDFTMTNGNGRIIKYGNGTETYFGLLNYAITGESIKDYFIIKTTIPKDRAAMNILQLQIFEEYRGTFDNITLQWYRCGRWVGQVRTSTGVKEVPIALGVTPDNMVAIIIGNPNFSLSYPSFNIPWCTAHFNFDGNDYKGWAVERRSDLTGYTDVVDLVNKETTTAVNWSRIGSKPTTLAGYGITDAWTSTSSDNRYVMLNESRAIALNNSVTMRKISLARNGGAGGISWYSEGYTAWQDYMAPPGAGNGYAGNITAPTGVIVTSWAKRSFIENSTGYGWTFEAGTGYGATPAVVAEIRSSDGSARFGGGLTAGGDISVGAKLNVTTLNSPGAFSFLNGSSAQQVMVGGALISNSYAELDNVPTNGLYSKGIILTEAGYGSKDVRVFAPSSMAKKSVNFYFTSENGLATGTTAGGNFGDFISLNSYNDDTGGNQNGLFFDKKNFRILHYSPAFGASTWGTPKQLAYTDSNITGNAATATKLQTARSIGDRVFDGTGNISLGGTIQTDTVYNGSFIGFYTAADKNTSQQIRVGSILVSSAWADAGYVPANGIYARGDIKTGGSVYAGGDVTAFSDRRLKENIEPITNALSKVKELNGVTYTRNDLDDKERVHIGLIAQDVQAVFPAAVHETKDGYLSLNYMGLVGSLVEAIKELDSKNQTLEARLAKLEEKLS